MRTFEIERFSEQRMKDLMAEADEYRLARQALRRTTARRARHVASALRDLMSSFIAKMKGQRAMADAQPCSNC